MMRFRAPPVSEILVLIPGHESGYDPQMFRAPCGSENGLRARGREIIRVPLGLKLSLHFRQLKSRLVEIFLEN